MQGKPRFPYGALERVMGIEPTSKAWEAFILPLNYTRLKLSDLFELLVSFLNIGRA